MKQIILFALLSLIFSCSQKKKESTVGKETLEEAGMSKDTIAVRWDIKDQKDFIESCVENAKGGIGEEKAVKYCDCMLEKVMKKYPDVYDAEKMTMGETMELAKECSN